jgi:uncharacterized protein (DUF1778 family)
VTTLKRKQKRAEGQTTVTLSCSHELKEKIRSAADVEHRSISNWVVYRIEQALSDAAALEASPPKLRRVAEDRSEYTG